MKRYNDSLGWGTDEREIGPLSLFIFSSCLDQCKKYVNISVHVHVFAFLYPFMDIDIHMSFDNAHSGKKLLSLNAWQSALNFTYLHLTRSSL